MNKTNQKAISKFLSFVLRHCPEDIGLQLDTEGWALISELIENAQPKMVLTQKLIEEVVAGSKKQRFKISDDGLKIRANQGHSIKVDLGLTAVQPPDALYHGTATRFIESILKEGLKAGKRQYVHLSTDIDTAIQVGQRYGRPVILKINAQAMFKQEHQFYLSENGVWLTSYVPSTLITINHSSL